MSTSSEPMSGSCVGRASAVSEVKAEVPQVPQRMQWAATRAGRVCVWWRSLARTHLPPCARALAVRHAEPHRRPSTLIPRRDEIVRLRQHIVVSNHRVHRGRYAVERMRHEEINPAWRVPAAREPQIKVHANSCLTVGPRGTRDEVCAEEVAGFGRWHERVSRVLQACRELWHIYWGPRCQLFFRVRALPMHAKSAMATLQKDGKLDLGASGFASFAEVDPLGLSGWVVAPRHRWRWAPDARGSDTTARGDTCPTHPVKLTLS